MLIYSFKMFKTFKIRISSYLLSTIGKELFDFEDLDYADVSQEIKKGIQSSSDPVNLTYLLDSI